MTKNSFDSLDDFIIYGFGIVESKADNRIYKFNTADQKFKIELYWIRHLEF